MTEKYLKNDCKIPLNKTRKCLPAILVGVIFFSFVSSEQILSFSQPEPQPPEKCRNVLHLRVLFFFILCLSECVNNIYILKNPKYFSPGQNIRSIKDLSLTIWALILALDLPWWWFDDFIIRACNKVKLVVEEVTETKYPLL